MTAVDVKVCKGCGISKPLTDFHKDSASRDGRRPRCKLCVKVTDDNRREKRNQRAREIYAADPATKITKARQYHIDHPEWSKERLRVHHVANREERYKRHVERGKIPEIAEKRRKATQRCESRRRAIKAGTLVEVISAEQFDLRLAEFGGRCHICEMLLTNNLHWDHYQPLTAGGTHTIDNLMPSCDLCNIRKSNCWPFTEERRKEIANKVRELRKQSVSQPGRG
jgi:hypothetical protein